VKLAAVPGVSPVSMQSPEHTTRALLELIVAARGAEAARDPGMALAAGDAAELAHATGAGLVALVEHPNADPGVLVGTVVTSDLPPGPDPAGALARRLDDGAEVREVTVAGTARGYPVVIAERLPQTGAQLQAVVLDPAGRRMAVFTLHSPTGRGWLELSGVLGELVGSVDFSVARSAQPARR
jgi:hypothetical protein